MTNRLILVFVFLFLAGAASAASPSPDPQSLAVPPQELSKARELVQQLGSEEFGEREQAERDLEQMGRIARAALLEGVNSDPNPEVRSRCQALLPRATALEMRARLDVFLADSAGKYDHDLPGWNEFRDILREEWSLFGYPIWFDASRDRTARKVFAELLSTPANREIVMAVGGSETQLSVIVAERRQELYNQKYGRVVQNGRIVSRSIERREPSVQDVAALLFAETHAASMVMPRNVSISVILSSANFSNAVRAGDEKGKVYQSLVGAWLDTRQDPVEMYSALNLAASQLGLPEHACRLAVRVLNAKVGQPFYRGQAAAILAQHGNKSHIPVLEPFLDDSTLLARQNFVKVGLNQLREFQVRDVALAAAIVLAGEEPTKFGFQDASSGNVARSFSYTRFFIEDKDRKEALEKWKAWREKNR